MRQYFCLVLLPCSSTELLGQILSTNRAVLCNSTTSEENAVNPPHKLCLALDVTTSARDILKRLKQPTLPVRQGKRRFCIASSYPEGKARPRWTLSRPQAPRGRGRSRGRLFTLLSVKQPAANGSSRNTSLHSLSCRRWLGL